MSFYNKDNYSYADIEYLLRNEVEEDVHLDYKEGRALAKTDPARCEITKDVSSFANSDGGIIVYGVLEKDNKPSDISPIDGRIFSKEWLENVIQSIQPRIENIIIYPIRVDNDLSRSIYVVKIPRSDNAPHMAKDKRYYKRFNFQSAPMEDYDVRDTYNRLTTPKLEIEGCAFFKKEQKDNEVTYYLKASIVNVGKNVCDVYKLNFYINNATYCAYSHQTLNIRNLMTTMDGNRAKLSLCNQVPIFPTEKIDMGNFEIYIDKQYAQIFIENLVIHMILFYKGGQHELAYIPSTHKFIEEREKIIEMLKEKNLEDYE